MWERSYKHNGMQALLVGGLLGAKGNVIGLETGDENIVNLIVNRDPKLFDLLVDVVVNIDDISDLSWASDAIWVNDIMPEKYEGNTEALQERIEYLLSVAHKFPCSEDSTKNLSGYLEWLKKKRVEDERKAANKAKAKIVRRELQRDYDRLFMQIGRRDGFCCVVCGCSTDLTIDHKLAVTNGGTNDPDNLQLMCMTHNREKGAK